MIEKAELETMNRGLRLIGLASMAAIISCTNPAHSDTIDIGDVTRTYTAELPETKPAPLVIVLHGHTQTGADMVERTSWPQVAKREGFGVVFPDGLNRAWADLRSSNQRAGRAPPDGTDDAAFIVRLAEEFVADGVADPKRIYVTGTETTTVFEQKGADHYTHVADVPTGFRARTSILVPELNRLYIAVSGKGKPDAKLALQIYELQP